MKKDHNSRRYTKMHFGKHKGKYLKDIPTNYVVWASKEMEDLALRAWFTEELHYRCPNHKSLREAENRMKKAWEWREKKEKEAERNEKHRVISAKQLMTTLKEKQLKSTKLNKMLAQLQDQPNNQLDLFEDNGYLPWEGPNEFEDRHKVGGPVNNTTSRTHGKRGN